MDINKTYELPFPVSDVFEAWTSSSTVIVPATRMNIDPKIGGAYELFMETPEGEVFNKGIFLELIPNERLKYTWEWNDDGQVTEITVVFSATQNGTRIELLHSGFTDRESLTNHDTGWDSYISGFTQYLST